MNFEPRIFIGCSQEAHRKNSSIASALYQNLRKWAKPEIWDQGFFGISNTIIESLEENLPKFDAAVFIFHKDDIIKIRNHETNAVRDNVLFEFGLAMGILGRKRTFFILPSDFNIRIPSDLNGLIAGVYNANATNLMSELHACSLDIQSSLMSYKTNFSFSKKPEIILDFVLHPNGIESSTTISNHIQKLFSNGLIRKRWVIDLDYDLSLIEEGILTEKIIWQYDITNITDADIQNDVTLYYYADERNQILKYTIDDGKKNIISLIDNQTITESGLFKNTKKTINFKAGQSYFVYMHFLLKHSVSPKTHRMHNCFVPREPTIGAQIKCHIPKGYVMDFIGAEPIDHSNFDNRYDFIINEPLAPEQAIEYVFEKTS